MDITDKTTGYEKKGIFDGMTVSRHALEMPERRFRTEGLWGILKNTEELLEKCLDPLGSLHVMEQVLISCIPPFAISEKGDIGGLSYQELFIEGERRPVICIYDAHAEGAGLTKGLLDDTQRWLRTDFRIVRNAHVMKDFLHALRIQCGSSKTLLINWGWGIVKRLIKE